MSRAHRRDPQAYERDREAAHRGTGRTTKLIAAAGALAAAGEPVVVGHTYKASLDLALRVRHAAHNGHAGALVGQLVNVEGLSVGSVHGFRGIERAHIFIDSPVNLARIDDLVRLRRDVDTLVALGSELHGRLARHGYRSEYRLGCRCDLCRHAEAGYRMSRRVALGRPTRDTLYQDATRLAARLRLAHAAGLTDRELARRTGIVHGTISRIRRGEVASVTREHHRTLLGALSYITPPKG